ncbi:MAG: SH3 domain-containing protein [Clostridiales bacterium]|nr:SH3 domain-containing protein [Clostridiales bacterium]
MKFIGLSDPNKITKDKMISSAVVTGIVLLCVLSSAGIVSMMNYKAQKDLSVQEEKVEQILDETTTSEELEQENLTESSSETQTETTSVTESTSSLSESVDVTGSDETSQDPTASSEEETTTTTAATTTTKAAEDTTTTKATTTKATTKATTTKSTLVEYYTVVYAKGVINVRSGPGKEYDMVKQLNEGDAIDVIAKTENGWYKTINGNYVLQSLTTKEKPKVTTTTTTTTKATTTTTTTKATKATTTKSTTAATTKKANIDGKDMVSLGTFKCTFYGPQPLPDGSYSTTTATGTKCKQGRTIAADWSVLPAGTVIYIKNDPLGGDGYYTVEDKGSGVRGKMIDIYVDDESAWDTTSVEVYIVK